MRLIITRHGETEENAAGIMQGHLPGTLNKKGLEQAQKVGERLKDEHIDYIYSSDLARAANTTKAIAQYHPTTPITFTTEIRERNLGEFQGKTKKQLGFDNIGPKELFPQPKKGETKKELLARGTQFIQYITTTHPDDTVLLVGHGGINAALICAITGKTFAELKTIGKLHNTGISIFDIQGENHNTITFNCAKHLD